MKQFKSLDEQVEHLKNNKKVIFDDKEKAKKDLYDDNYYNIISCSKIKFAEDMAKKDHVYSQKQFKDWLAYFELDCRVSKYLMQNMIDFERKMNSRVAYRISELIEKNKLSNFEKNDLMQIIQKSQAWNSKEIYHGREAWVYITKMIFGEMKKLVFWPLKNRSDVYKKVVIDYPYFQTSKNNEESHIKAKFNELNNLRNCLFHFTPLTIYVTYGKSDFKKLDNRRRKLAIRWILQLSRNEGVLGDITEIFCSSDRFISLKNSQ